MVKFIESELVLLKKEIDEMWTLVYNQLDRAGEAVLTLDRELAQQAGVSVRTIQQYEQRRKDINKAQTETLLKIARALVCTVEDLVEKVPT